MWNLNIERELGIYRDDILMVPTYNPSNMDMRKVPALVEGFDDGGVYVKFQSTDMRDVRSVLPFEYAQTLSKMTDEDKFMWKLSE